MKANDTIVARGIPDVAIIQRAALRDPELSWEAVGLLAYMLALRPGEEGEFKSYIERRAAPCTPIDELLDELSDAGYVLGHNGLDDDVLTVTDRPAEPNE